MPVEFIPASVAGGSATPGVVREGGSTTQATTTSTTAVDLISISGLIIQAIEPIDISVLGRKDGGAANGAALGVKLNSSNILTPTAAAVGIILFSTDNEEQHGGSEVTMGARVSAITRGFAGYYGVYNTSNTRRDSKVFDDNMASGMPSVQITDVVITGISGNASITLYADELHIYARDTG